MANDIISLPSLSGAIVWIGMDLLNPPQPPESSSTRRVVPTTQVYAILSGYLPRYPLHLSLSATRAEPILSRFSSGFLHRISYSYLTATVIETPNMIHEQNMSRHICVKAVFPIFESSPLLIFVAIVGCGKWTNLLVLFHFLQLWQCPISSEGNVSAWKDGICKGVTYHLSLIPLCFYSACGMYGM